MPNFKVTPEKYRRVKNLNFLVRIDKFLNLSAIARALPSCKKGSTLVSRLNRGTQLDQNVDQKAFAEDISELMNEIFWELGVGLGHFPFDGNKKYRFIWNDDSERLKDVLDDLEAKSEK